MDEDENWGYPYDLGNLHMNDLNFKSGWWLTYPSEKYEFVSWDDDIPNIDGKVIKFHGSKPQTR